MDRQVVLTRVGRIVTMLALAATLPAVASAVQIPSPYKPSPPVAAPVTLKKATPDDLAAVRVLLKGGQFEAALDAARALDPDPGVLRLRIEAALGLEQPGEALAEYAHLATALGAEDLPLLETISRLVIVQALATPDPLLVIDACAVLLTRAPAPCAKSLAEQADDGKAPFALRIAALAALARTDTPGALDKLQRLAATAAGPQMRSVVDAAGSLPGQVAVPLLARALGNEDQGIQFAAAAALGGYRTPEARSALEQYLATDPPGMPRGSARLSLARLGDDRWFKEFLAVLPELQGDMLLELGVMLLERGDPRGAEAIARVAASDHELLRLTAGARLPPSSDAARKVLEEGLDNVNPYTRAAALDAFRDSPLLTVARARGLLADVAPWVRVRAAQVLFSRMGSPAQSRPAQRP